MVFLLHVGRLTLAISRFVSRNRILWAAAFSHVILLHEDTEARLQTALHILIRELLFANDMSFVSHSETGFQSLIDHFAACQAFSLFISNRKHQLQKAPKATSTGLVLSNSET